MSNDITEDTFLSSVWRTEKLPNIVFKFLPTRHKAISLLLIYY